MEDKDFRVVLRELLDQRVEEEVAEARAGRSAAGGLDIVSERQNQSVVGVEGGAEAAALSYDDDESLVRTVGKGWRFRLKGNVLHKNLSLVTAVAEQQRKLLDAKADLEEAETGYQNRVELVELKTALERQELETGIAEEELKKFKAEQELERLNQANLPEQEPVPPRRASEEKMKDAIDKATSKARARREAKRVVRDREVALIKEGVEAGEIREEISRLERDILRGLADD